MVGDHVTFSISSLRFVMALLVPAFVYRFSAGDKLVDDVAGFVVLFFLSRLDGADRRGSLAMSGSLIGFRSAARECYLASGETATAGVS
jgi:hypothetical protein